MRNMFEGDEVGFFLKEFLMKLELTLAVEPMGSDHLDPDHGHHQESLLSSRGWGRTRHFGQLPYPLDDRSERV